MPKVSPHILMVEGKTDRHVIYQLRDQHGIPDCFEVRDYNGVDSLLDSLPATLKESERERIGVVVDADMDLDARWLSVRNILRSGGYDQLPNTPAAEGTLIPAPQVFRPAVGIWIMPDNTVPGLLEDFLQFLVPPEDQLIRLAREAVSRIPASQRRFNDANEVKAQLHTWLAWQAQPGIPLGIAIKARYLDGDRPEARVFAGWLRRLFVEAIASAGSAP